MASIERVTSSSPKNYHPDEADEKDYSFASEVIRNANPSNVDRASLHQQLRSIKSDKSDILMLRSSAQCCELFRHYLNNDALSDEDKVDLIRAKVQKEAKKTLGSEIGSNVENLIQYIESDARNTRFKKDEVEEKYYLPSSNSPNTDRTFLQSIRKSDQCCELFKRYLDNDKLNDQEKVNLIKSKAQREVDIFELKLGNSVEDLIRYVEGPERSEKITLAKIHFATVLLKLLGRSMPNEASIGELKIECDTVLYSDEPPEGKAKKLDDLIKDWQKNNPKVVEHFTKIDLNGQRVQYLPSYITAFNLESISLNGNRVINFSILHDLKLESIDYDDRTDVDRYKYDGEVISNLEVTLVSNGYFVEAPDIFFETTDEKKATITLLNLNKAPEFLHWFSDIIHLDNKSNLEKLSLIKEKLKSEGLQNPTHVAEVVNHIIKVRSSITSSPAEHIHFVKMLLQELSKKHPVKELKTTCDKILSSEDSEKEKALKLHHAIVNWQVKNPEVVQQITSIKINRNKFKVIPVFMEGFSNLISLDLNGNLLTNVPKLNLFKRLKYLYLSRNPTQEDMRGISDLSFLENCTELIELDLGNHRAIEDISVLAVCKKLERLWLDFNHVNDISALASCTRLKNLSLGRNAIKDISALSNCKNLEVLLLYDNLVGNAKPLASCTSLNNLDLRNNCISDISDLSNCRMLKYLDLKNNCIQDITALRELTNLESLDLRDNAIKLGESVLGNLRNLKYLFLSNCFLSKLPDLSELANLKKIFLDGNDALDWIDLEMFGNLYIYGSLRTIAIRGNGEEFSPWLEEKFIKWKNEMRKRGKDNELPRLSFTKI